MSSTTPRTAVHPLALAAGRAAHAARQRAGALSEKLLRLYAGEATTIADAVEAAADRDAAARRMHEAERRLITLRLARAHHDAVGQDLLASASRLARQTLAEDVRGDPL
jgi:hypothetical protein